VDPLTGVALGPNEEGEVLVQTPGVMKGYLKNDEATRNVIDEQGWVHTGDLGYHTAQGVFYISGRSKDLLKIDNHQVIWRLNKK